MLFVLGISKTECWWSPQLIGEWREISMKESALGTLVQSFECQTKEYKIECDTKHCVFKKYFSAVYESSD